MPTVVKKYCLYDRCNMHSSIHTLSTAIFNAKLIYNPHVHAQAYEAEASHQDWSGLDAIHFSKKVTINNRSEFLLLIVQSYSLGYLGMWGIPEKRCIFSGLEFAGDVKGHEVIKGSEGIWGDLRGSEGIWGDMRGSGGIRGDLRGPEGVWGSLKDLNGSEGSRSLTRFR